MSKFHESSGNETIAQLAQNYYNMRGEAKNFSKLVERQLQQYNHEILKSSTVIRDMHCLDDGGGGGGGGTPPACTFDCWSGRFLVCLQQQVNQGLLQCGFLCVLASGACGPLYPACLEGCLGICGFEAIAGVLVCAIMAMSECNCL